MSTTATAFTALQDLKDRRSPTPLSTYLHIYRKTRRLCYVDWMEGARALASYLSPIAIPAPIYFKAPAMFTNYEVQKLAAILASFPEGREGANLEEWNHVMAAIVEEELRHAR